MPEQSRQYLPDTVLRLLLEFMQGMVSGMVNLRRYPKGSEVVQPSLRTIDTSFKKIHFEIGELTMGESEGKLIVNSVPLPDSIQRLSYVESLAKYMFARRLRSISFKEGLSQDEMVKFLEILGQLPDELQKLGKLSSYLANNGILHIGVDEKIFVAVKKGESVVSKTELERMLGSQTVPGSQVSAGAIISHIFEKIALAEANITPEKIRELSPKQLIELLNKTAPLLDAKLSEPTTADPLLQRLASALEPLVKFRDPELRKRLIESLTWLLSNLKIFTLAQLTLKKLPAPLEELGLLQELASTLSPQKRAELVDDIWTQLENKVASLDSRDLDFSMMQLEKAEKLISHLAKLATTETETQSIARATQTTKKVKLDLEKSGGDFGILKVEHLSSRPAEFFLQPKVAKDLLVFLKSLAEKQRADLLIKLAPKLFEIGRQRDARLTVLGLRGLVITLGLVPSSERSRLLSLFVGLDWQKAQNPDLSKELYALTEKLVAERDEPSLDSLAGMVPVSLDFSVTAQDQDEWIKSLQNKLLNGQDLDKVLKILKFLSSKLTTTTVIEVMKESSDRRVRRAMVDKAIELGTDIADYLVAELNTEHPWYVHRNIILILAELGKKPSALARFRAHPEPKLRRAAYQALIKLQAPELIEGLKDSDLVIRMIVASYLGATKNEDAVKALLDTLKNQRRGGDEDRVTAEICLALGRIGDKRAIEPLLKLAVPKKFFRTQSPKVLAAAASALGELQALDAKKILKELCHHSDLKVCQAANSALQKLGIE